MAADQLRRRLAAGLVGQIGEFCAGLLLHEHGEHMVLALGAGAAHLERRACSLRSGDEFLHGLRAGSVVPQHELIERDHRHRRKVAPVERNLGRQRQHVDQRIGDQHLVGVAFAGLHVHQRFGTRRAALQRHHHRLLHQIIFLDRGLHHPRHLVGGAAGAGGDHDFDRLGRLPGGKRRRARENGRRGGHGFQQMSHVSLPYIVVWIDKNLSLPAPIVETNAGQFKASGGRTLYDFGMRRPAAQKVAGSRRSPRFDRFAAILRR